MKAIAFDLGDTLIEYEGLPLSWEAHYGEALLSLATFLGFKLTNDQLEAACAVLRRYNTRIHPRTDEVSFAQIARELTGCFEHQFPDDELVYASVFFDIFRQRLQCFPEVPAVISALRARSLRLGIFTDVPYGMPRELVMEDLVETGLQNSFDTILTSRDSGHRKPSPVSLGLLAGYMECQPSEMVYVGNEKKDMDAARAAGCHAILIDRKGHGNNWGQDRTITALTEI
ncbi:MAG: HAD family hydrolase [Cephaloticoccus sp.]|nr:HAD family hydrolase [Cephaloticoccus sp.]